jgi:uncharacterized protein YcnI
MSRSLSGAAAIAALLAATPAFAHVELEVDKAPAASSYKAVLMVPHGCAGSPTVAIKVQIPDGVVHAQPMPKAGWTVTTVVKKLDQPVKYYDATLTEDVREIAWTGGSLPDAYYDEFVFVVHLPDKPGAVIRFPTVQQCAKGVHRWIEIPAQGQDAEELKEPAPSLTLGPKAAGGDD